MIKLDLEQFQKAQEIMREFPSGVIKAAVLSVNRSVRSAQTEAATRVAKKYVVSKDYVKSRLGKPRLASIKYLNASIGLTSKPRNLTSFEITPRHIVRGKGARSSVNRLLVKVKKGGNPKPLTGHFLIKSRRGGSLLIAKRAGGKSQKSSYPLKIRHGPSISQMLGNKEVYEKIIEKAEKRLMINFDSELNKLMKKGYGI